MEKNFHFKKWVLIVLFGVCSILSYAQTSDTDLTTHEPTVVPSGATFEWREGAMSSSALVSTPTAVQPGLYYGYYNFGAGCFSEGTPISIITNACPTETVDLNSAVDTPTGEESFHSALPVSDANEITGTAITEASIGATYYVAYKTTVDGSSCYSEARPIVAAATTCAPTAVDDSGIAPFGTTTSIDILGNDDFLANDGNTITAVAGGTATGTIVFDPITGELDYTPILAEAGTNVTVNYEVCDGPECAQATVLITVPADTDGDGNPDVTDLDDDNDGILDTDECPTTSLLFDIGWNSNKSPFNEQDGVWQDPSDGTSTYATLTYWDDGQTGVDLSVISGQGGNYVIGSGLTDLGDGFNVNSSFTTAQEVGDAESNLALAKTDGDYIDYPFQTGSFVSAGINNLGTASWDGYNFSMYAEIYETAAGAGTATLLLPEVLIRDGNQVLNTAFGSSYEYYALPVSYYAVSPNTDYTVRVYYFNPVNSPSPTTLIVDDFQIGFVSCDTDGDGVPNLVDLDSDNDDCPDFVEGGGTFALTDGTTASGTVSSGTGSTVTTNLGTVVNTDPMSASYGVPTVAGAGQSIGTANDDNVSACTDTDGDGVTDADELNPPGGEPATNPNDPCSFIASDVSVAVSGDYLVADCDGDGVTNGDEIDPDGDGTPGGVGPNGPATDPDDPCSLNIDDVSIAATSTGDCDGDGVTNADEINSTDPTTDPQTDPTDPCDYNAVEQMAGNVTPAWEALDCDNDNVTNGTELTDTTDPLDPDTDGDGNPDGQDTNPLVPTAVDDNGTASPTVLTTIDILDNDDYLPNNDPTNEGTTSITDTGDGTAAGTIAFDPTDGTLDYTPTPAEAGMTVTVVYEVCNNESGVQVCDEATVTIVVEDTTDTDGDGEPDVTDIDDDNDGIPDVVEAATARNNGDTDGDGIPDTLDLDADNDGIADIIEAGGIDTNGDGLVDDPTDTDMDGLADIVDVNPAVEDDPTTLAEGLAVTELPVPDTDGDGRPDFQDLDADNDGINDIEEAGIADLDNNGIVDDVNPDGTLSNDPDMDGLAGSLDPTTGGTPVVPADTDGDDTPDYLDLDSDNDGINDVIEGGNGPADTDGDGTIDEGGDTDMDGIPDVVDETPADYGDGNAANPNDAPTDTDGDNVPDYQDLDSDNDSINDTEEAGLPDPNGDGLVDNPLTDTDGDGIPDSVDGAPGVFADEPGTGDDPTDTDNDNTPDFQETDSDNDGTLDIVEGGDDPTLDGDGDGEVDDTTDPDGDGIVGPADLDPNNFGDAPDTTDTDGDGEPDVTDIDDDNDGIPDVVEAATARNNGDTDGDGIPDTLDLDADNDGIADIIEAGGIDTNGDGLVDDPTDTDMDGLADIVDVNPTVEDEPTTLAEGLAVTELPVPDTDGDGRPDFQDLDADNDGINDIEEAGIADLDNNGIVDDVNPDGTLSNDPDMDGLAGSLDPTTGGTPVVPADTDGDDTPDYLDLDSDNDGINDVIEGGNGPADTDGDGTIDEGGDTDMDGIPDVVDETPADYGDGNAANPNDAPTDTDGDNVPDYQDLDSDNDSINDTEEAGLPDPNGDGLVDNPLTDTDGDGIPDSVDGAPGVFADEPGTGDDPTDTDNDNTPDFQETDSDNDGTPDIVEDGDNPALDGDGDGEVDDTTDPDGDGIVGPADLDPNNFGDAPDTTDTDGDGEPDVTDIDDDNDGIPDVVEAATARNNGDTDGDGIPDTLDLDADNDGIADIIEAGGIDTNGDGLVDDPTDTDMDGLADIVDVNPAVEDDPTTLAEGLAVTELPVPDTDGDGRPDFQDLDADNDGINDIEEAGIADLDNNGIVDDVNPDGTLSNDPDMDGLAGSLDPTTGGTPVVPADTDGDDTPDYLDLDSDNDGINDVIEGGNGPADTDGDGTIDEGGDTDMDGIPDVVDETPADYGDGNAANPNDAPTDTDGDNVPDYQDLDSDNDSINDTEEAGLPDPNGDGLVDNPLTDTDGDGIPDSVDGAPGVFADEPGTGDDPTDTDNDNTPDFQETDSDNDGTPDIVEDGDNPALDGDGDGEVDDTTDPDGDGIVGPADLDPNNFGDAPDTTDTDGDGEPDVTDIDDDNDGIPDVVEAATARNNGDTDGDGIPDTLDLDADNDGIADIIEAGGIDTNGDGLVDDPTDTDMDGLADIVDVNPTVEDEPTTLAEGLAVTELPVPDTDGDGRPDFQDLDADNDGINDIEEAGIADLDNNGIVDDVNPDGTLSNDPDMDGLAGSLDPTTGGTPVVPADTDGDDTPDYLDLDSDNDGINDVIEGGNGPADTDGDGTIDEGGDTDMDGIPDVVDETPADYGDGNAANPNDAPTDTDGDNVPDYQDLDSDNDSINDTEEAGLPDPNGDGLVDNPLTDTDGDGIPDSVDGAPGVFADEPGTGDDPTDTDNDNTPDFQETDSDNDGTPDIVEDGDNPALDGDGDGEVDDTTDPDGDGIVGPADLDPNNFGDAPDTTDTDGDGEPDVTDIDDDNDGIPDVVEAATARNNGDTDGDGIPDTLDLDADNDGIADIIEAGGIDTNGDGLVDDPTDTDMDGLADIVDVNPTVEDEPTTLAEGLAVTELPVPDTDGDGRPDFQDLDADNDGINDIEEAGIADLDNNGIVDDVNPDGTLSNDPDMDGLAGSLDPTTGGTPVVPADTDGDDTPDYLDLDSDNDGINDVIEGGNGPADTDGDGTIDEGGDTDMDGIPDVVDETPADYGDGNAANPNDAPTDTDGDNVPDYQDLDSDNDSINDTEEAGLPDPNGDGLVDNPLTDTDGDGIPDSVDGAPGVFADEPGTGDDPTDTDNDNTPDFQETDSDNDGTPDIVEGGDDPTLDGDGDGEVDDTTDPDGDGIVGPADLDPNNFGDALGAVSCSIDVAVWLEGSYEVTQNEMRTDLNDQQLLPGQDPVFFLGTETPAGQPYNVAPWNYNGTEGDAFDYNTVGVGSANYDADVTDWVLVSLRTSTLASSTICTQAAWLLKDGTITFPEQCDCALTVGQEVYIVIEHRNHLPVMTPTAVTVTTSGVAFDFRTQQSFVTFTGDGQKMLEGGVFGMFAANGDQTTTFGSRTDVNATDESIWTGSNSSGDIYIIGDFDMNGDVNADDESLWLENTGKSSDVNY